ncbi:NUDIX domain-containing protein [Candidatus Saccharibacteria bacterium]|nr:NUDIX domain-containing protein [Candidatus Saccharibacteria bacterium]
MSAQSATPNIASYVLIERDGEYVFLLRDNTSWMNGYYSLPAGKVDVGEPYTTAAVRETKEEINVDIQPEDLRFVHMMYRHDDTDFVDVYFVAKKWSGKVENLEPHKHKELAWFTLDMLPENIEPCVKFALQQIQANKQFSEYNW